GKVVNDVNLVLAADGDNAGEEVQVHALRRGVGRKIQNQELRTRVHQPNRLLQLRREIDALPHGNGTNVCSRDHRTINVDGIARVWNQHGVATVKHRQTEM